MFDNHLENYLAWKSSFRNAIDELRLKPSENLDLLTKWLDGEALQHARRIRAANVLNPTTGLISIWQRLDKKYGSSEAIESSLFSRLDNFQKNTQ